MRNTTVQRLAVWVAGCWVAFVTLTPAVAQLTADGSLDEEAKAVLDLDPPDGTRDILETRFGAAFFQLDNRLDEGVSWGLDGFHDAALGPARIPDCAECKEIDTSGAKRARSPINVGKLTVIYLPDSNGVLDLVCETAQTPCQLDDDCPVGDVCVADPASDDSVLYVGFDIGTGDARRVPRGAVGDEDWDYHDIDYVLDAESEETLCSAGWPDDLDNATGLPQDPADPDHLIDYFMVPFDSDGDGDPSFISRFSNQLYQPCIIELEPSRDQHEEAYAIEIATCDYDGFAPLLMRVQLKMDVLGGVDAVVLEITPPNDPWPALASAAVFPEPGTTGEQLKTMGKTAFQEYFPGAPPDDYEGPLDVEFIVEHIDSVVQKKFETTPFELNRFRLFQGKLVALGKSAGDISPEDEIHASFDLEFPDIEVTKQVRCEGEGDDQWRESAEALPGSVVEFKIEVQNTGNVDLGVCLADVLAEFAPAGVAVDLASPLTATLYRPADNPAGVPYGDARVCDDYSDNPGDLCEDDPDCPNGHCIFLSNPFFFAPGAGGFLGAIEQGTGCYDDPAGRTYLGPLRGVDVCSDPANPVAGDRVVVTFKATVTAPEDFCDDPHNPIDVQNAITVVGDPDIPDGNTLDPPNGNEAEDTAGGDPDTPREIIQGYDDNVVEVNLLCRNVTFEKEVGLPDEPDSFTTGDVPLNVPSIPPGGSVQIEFRYSGDNTGEVREEVTITDDFLCSDIAATQTAFPGKLTIIDCPICPDGEITLTVEPGEPYSESCVIEFTDQDALRDFLARDDAVDPDHSTCKAETDPAECYRNCAHMTADAMDIDHVCGDAETIAHDSYATICNRECQIEVTKRVRCLDNCTHQEPVGSLMDMLKVAWGACVQFEIKITNTGDVMPICRLRIDDELDNQPANIVFEDSVHFRVDGQECSVPGDFNVDGNPFEWDPSTCGLDALAIGEVLTITFNASIPPDADSTATPTNTVEVACASVCEPAPAWGSPEVASASVEILEAHLECDKEWAFQADSNVDCEPDPPFGPFSSSVDLRTEIFPVLLRLRVTARNTGDVPLSVTASDDGLVGCVNDTDGVSFVEPPDCEIRVPTPKTIMPGGTEEWFCDIRVETAKAMRALDACDGTGEDGVYDNTASVDGTLMANDTGICVPQDSVVSSECSARIDVPEACEFTLAKDVKCKDDPDDAFAQDADALPGSTLSFRIRICNTGTVKIPRVKINDHLDPSDGLQFMPGSLVGELHVDDCKNRVPNDDVTDCICPPGGCNDIEDINGEKTFGAAACRPDAPYIEPGECLTITFDVQIPADFDTVGEDPDITNTVTVEGFSEVCVPAGLPDEPCDTETDDAEIDVLIPDMACVKEACADLTGDGDCDDPGEPPFASVLRLPCDFPLPFTLVHRVRVSNPGETTLIDVEACDPPYGCKPCGTGTLLPGESCEVTWLTPVADRVAWDILAASDDDGDDDCYSDTATGTGNVDTTSICDFGADADVDTSCSAQACFTPPCEIEVDKQVRCLPDCDPGSLGPEEGWVGVGKYEDNNAALELTAGSCVQYRIIVDNVSTDDVAVCALYFCDLMSLPDSFASGPNNVEVIGPTTCQELPGGFNWDDECVLCRLYGDPLEPGESLMVRFQAVLGAPDPGAEPMNRVVVQGWADGDCPVNVGCPPECEGYCCEDADQVPLDVKDCSIEVTKDVTCDEPRLPNGEINPAANWAHTVDALPASTAAFRVQVCNTGEVALSHVNIEDALDDALDNVPDCGPWFVPGSVVATINGEVVTDCICPAGGCDQVTDINGDKTFANCRPGAPYLAPGECLTITFKVSVPSGFATAGTLTDCVNTVTVDGFTDVCSPPDGCGKDDASAEINVLVPDITCEKTACADLDQDDACAFYSPYLPLQEGDVEYPLTLFYRFVVNAGETDLEDVTLCDPLLFLAPGFGGCVPPDLANGCLDIGHMSAGESVEYTCRLVVSTYEAWENLDASDDPPLDGCFYNTAEATGTPTVGDEVCHEPPLPSLPSHTCEAIVCVEEPPCIPRPCPPHTKVNVDIWNQNEAYFGGTHRCISSWDQTLLSEYTGGASNHFWRHILQTDKGKARINGISSPVVCGDESVDVPLLGVANKLIKFSDDLAMAGMPLVGQKYESGQILYDVFHVRESNLWVDATGQNLLGRRDVGPPRTIGARNDLAEDMVGPIPADVRGGPDEQAMGRASTTQQGSFLVYPNVEIKWDREGNVIQDTFLDITNDYPADVVVKLYFVNQDLCIWVDNVIGLTNNQSTYWSVLTGLPRGVTPFTVFAPEGCRDDDPLNQGGRRLYGYVLAWAIDRYTGEEIRWNYLQGNATIVNYQKTAAWEYSAWAFKALAGTNNGDPLLDPPGQLDLDGIEYDAAPGMLLLDFYASGATLVPGVHLDTDLTLWAAVKDLQAH